MPIMSSFTVPEKQVASAQQRQLKSFPTHPLQHEYFQALALEVARNLQYQQNWSAICLHNTSPVTGEPLPRPIISGMPPRRIYIHPDDQVEEIKLGLKDTDVEVEGEWVLPTRLREKWSLHQFAEMFDAITVEPNASSSGVQQVCKSKEPLDVGEMNQLTKKRHVRRTKRLLLATAGDDSTVVYYIVHDGIVKPRQN